MLIFGRITPPSPGRSGRPIVGPSVMRRTTSTRPAIAYMEVAFFDTNGMVLGASFDSGSGTYPAPFKQYGFGVYGSAVLDPNAAGVPGGPYDFIIAPPPANDPSGWMFLQATNFYYGYTNAANGIEPGRCCYGAIEDGFELPITNTDSSILTNLVAPPGTAFVRFILNLIIRQLRRRCLLGRLCFGQDDLE